jgi:hypothetical protein
MSVHAVIGHHLPPWAAALLSHIITGAATGGVDDDVVPEPYRSAGINVLLDRELITATGTAIGQATR